MTSKLPPVTFEDLTASRTFAEFADLVRELTGIPVAVVDTSGQKSKRMFQPEVETPLCRLINSVPAGVRACRHTDTVHFARVVKTRRPCYYTCHAGLLDIAVPIYIAGRHVATINCGQILPAPPAERHLLRYLPHLVALGLPAAALRRAYFKCPHCTPAKFMQTVRLLMFFAEYCGEVGQRLKVAEPTGRAPVDRAKLFAWEHAHEPIGLREAAAQAGYSPAYFSTLFNKIAGRPWTAFLQQVRLSKALRLLEKSDLSVTDVAFAAGFGSLTHFNRVFRKFQGCAPTIYRHRQQAAGIVVE